jgi:ferredoxin
VNRIVKVKITVDRSACIACGVAPNQCPEVFVLGDDNGKTRIVEKYSEETSDETSSGAVPSDLHDCAKEAADLCPVQAIKLQEIEH